MITDSGGRRIGGGLGLSLAALWLATYLGARFAVEMLPAGSTLRVVAAVAPALPFLAVLWYLRHAGLALARRRYA